MNDGAKAIVHCLLFVSGEPVDARTISRVSGLSTPEINAAVRELDDLFERHGLGLEIVEMDEGWQMQTRSEYADYVEKMFPLHKRGLSHAALETLSIIAYKQPITRAEIEGIRGVRVERVIQTLIEKNLVEGVGKKEAPGRPLLYRTTVEFLRQFGLQSLSDLPSLEEFRRTSEG